MPACCVRLPHRADRPSGIASQTFQVAHHQAPLNFHVIHLLQIRPVLQHFGRKIAVISQKNQAHRVVVQTPDGINPFRQALQTIHQRLAPFRVGHRSHNLWRLIQHDVNAALIGFHHFAGSFDAVRGGVRLRAQLRNHLAIDSHLPAQDQLFSVTPRSDSRSRDDFL